MYVQVGYITDVVCECVYLVLLVRCCLSCAPVVTGVGAVTLIT